MHSSKQTQKIEGMAGVGHLFVLIKYCVFNQVIYPYKVSVEFFFENMIVVVDFKRFLKNRFLSIFQTILVCFIGIFFGSLCYLVHLRKQYSVLNGFLSVYRCVTRNFVTGLRYIYYGYF